MWQQYAKCCAHPRRNNHSKISFKETTFSPLFFSLLSFLPNCALAVFITTRTLVRQSRFLHLHWHPCARLVRAKHNRIGGNLFMFGYLIPQWRCRKIIFFWKRVFITRRSTVLHQAHQPPGDLIHSSLRLVIFLKRKIKCRGGNQNVAGNGTQQSVYVLLLGFWGLHIHLIRSRWF